MLQTDALPLQIWTSVKHDLQLTHKKKNLPTDLDSFHSVVFVQFVDVVGDAGVEWCGGDRVNDCCIVGLLLVALTVGIDQQGNQAAKNGAAEPHGDHVEEVEIWK